MGERAEKTLTRRRLLGGALLLGAATGAPVLAETSEEKAKRLLEAVEAANAPAVRGLLDSGANPDARDADRNTPLILLCTFFEDEAQDGFRLPRYKAKEREELVSALLRHGAKPGAANKAGVTPLMCAAASMGRHLESARLLLERGAPVNAVDRQAQSALMFACGEFGDAAMVRLLLARRADLDLRDREGNTALRRALANRQSACAEALLKAGARE